MTKYKLKKVESSFGEIESLEYTDENGIISFIPIDQSNSDYQRYLRWLEDPTAEDEAQSL